MKDLSKKMGTKHKKTGFASKEVSVREFFIKRFGRKPEFDKEYFKTWERRFASGKPEIYMDYESLRVYKMLKGKK
jgi:hypothetical protein